MLERWILHCDCNSFFASVELLDRPDLAGECVAVCGDPESRKGIILAKNDAAKAFGVQTAEPIWQAKQKCPNLILLKSHRHKYTKYYTIINQIYCKYSDLVEPFSIDESWLDISGSWQLFASSPVALADAIRGEVQAATGLTISVGVSFNKIFAKLGSDYKKPNATTVITRQNYQQVLWPLPVGDMIFVGASAQKKLAVMNIRTIGQLAQADPDLLETMLGKLGTQVQRYAQGKDDAPVRRWGETEPVKSVGNGMTFKRDLLGEKDIRPALNVLADEVASRLRRHSLWASAVQITIKDTALKTITRQKQLTASTHLSSQLAATCWELVAANWNLRQPIRMLTITALNLTDEPNAVQQTLFGDAPKPDEKRESLEKSMDAIRKKYGKHSIGAASVIKNELGFSGISMQQPQTEADADAPAKGPLED